MKAGWRQVSSATWEWFIYTEGDNGKHTNTACPHGKNISLGVAEVPYSLIFCDRRNGHFSRVHSVVIVERVVH